MNSSVLSWNRWPKYVHQNVIDIPDRYAALPRSETSLLPYGNGRSYGDVCLNEGNTLLKTRRLNHFIEFDRRSGRLACEAGLLLKDILDLIVPQGWFLPVTPGTRFVTVGGAIANDVHGKNHHSAASFGNHVLCFELARSDGQRILCNPTKHSEMFSATIGGLGLTGLITWAEIQLVPICNSMMLVEARKFATLDEFWSIDTEAASHWPYTVGWIDCLSGARQGGRGLYFSGRHAPYMNDIPIPKNRQWRVSIDPPFSLVTNTTLRLFNTLYYRMPRARGPALVDYTSYFYPLDGILEWNRIYGRKGFFQYQCVLPPDTSRDGIRALLARIGKSGQGSFLAVIKRFGDIPSKGMLSFPRPGVTLALDFPNRDQLVLRLFQELDTIAREAGGALYPAKDARMPPDLFRSGYPKWEQFSRFIDPKFSSSFWRRVSA